MEAQIKESLYTNGRLRWKPRTIKVKSQQVAEEAAIEYMRGTTEVENFPPSATQTFQPFVWFVMILDCSGGIGKEPTAGLPCKHLGWKTGRFVASGDTTIVVGPMTKVPGLSVTG